MGILALGDARLPRSRCAGDRSAGRGCARAYGSDVGLFALAAFALARELLFFVAPKKR
jgi:hypothetical protein